MNCDTCAYLGSQTTGGIPSLQGTTQPQHNVCRRNAPGARGWPIIPFPNTDWCGQYKPKMQPERGTCGNCRHMERGGVHKGLLVSPEERNECHEQPRPVWTNSGIATFPPIFDWESCDKWEAKP